MGTDYVPRMVDRAMRDFPNIEFFLVVGIGGRVPSYGPPEARSEMILRDVVVSMPVGRFAGIVRVNAGAWTDYLDRETIEDGMAELRTQPFKAPVTAESVIGAGYTVRDGGKRRLGLYDVLAEEEVSVS
jgi:hypothetical protein